jgi:pimeloyl-ACP methyl ester carboxylesterase
VVRPYTPVRGTPSIGTAVWVDPFAYQGDPRSALGLAFDDVSVHSDVGALPTWYVPGAADATTWVIFVHGRGGTRAESLRYLTAWHALGLPVVVPMYRNDVGAPPSPDGRYHLGETEWRDAAAAVQWALTKGARDVVLAGWSMGGAIALQVADRAAVAATVRGLVLDSPVLDWRDVFASQGTDRGLPRPLTAIAVRVVEQRIGLDADRYDWPKRAKDLRVPVLLFHSDADSYVPDGPSRALAKARPDLVTFVDVPGAEHTRAWNVDPKAYERAMATWLSALLGR